MHSINVPYQDILPALTISTPYQHTLSAHPTYQLAFSITCLLFSRYCFSPSLAHIRRAANAANDTTTSSTARRLGSGQGLGRGPDDGHSTGISGGRGGVGGGGAGGELSSHTAPSLLSMTQLVLSILCRETAGFLPDLETAEEQLLLKQQPQPQPQPFLSMQEGDQLTYGSFNRHHFLI